MEQAFGRCVVSDSELIIKTIHTIMCTWPFHGSLTQWDILPRSNCSSLSQPLNHAKSEKMFEIPECAIVDNDFLLLLKSYVSKPTNTWKGNDKENARFLLSYNKIVMFTVANPKPIGFHFHPPCLSYSRQWRWRNTGKGVYFIRKKIQSELWEYVNNRY